MQRLLFYIFGALALLLSQGISHAQRTSERTFFAEVTPAMSVSTLPSGGLSIGMGQYIFNSFWRAELSAVDFCQRTTLTPQNVEGPRFSHTHWCARGGWLYRLCGSYSRAVSLYGGASIFLGAQTIGTFRALPPESDGSMPKGEFIYGIAPELLAEFFVSRMCALTVGVQGPFTLGSSVAQDLFHVTLSVGVRVNL